MKITMYELYGKIYDENPPKHIKVYDKDLFIAHCTDEFDSTYCDHYFKAVINDEYKDLIKVEK